MKIGILGGGQLARMLSLAAAPMGITTLCLDATPNVCASHVTDVITADLSDQTSLSEFAYQVDAITIETENIPIETAKWVAEQTPFFPSLTALEISQDRLSEKSFCQQHDIPCAAFWPIHSLVDLEQATQQSGFPALLKTRRLGYDGKGQYLLQQKADMVTAWQQLNNDQLILEQWVNFQRELSCLAVRDQQGQICFYPLTENHHINGILHCAQAPFNDNDLQQQAKRHTSCLLTSLNYVGMLAIEFFQVENTLLFNEMAPRVHNSGHWTIEGAATSQFDNHIRAIAGLPLGQCRAIGFSAMLNCIGSEPDPKKTLNIPYSHWHSYGKTARANRKLGHVTLHTADEETLASSLKQLNQIEPFATRGVSYHE